MRLDYPLVGKWALNIAIGFLLMAQGLYLVGICFNTTRSMPVGIYKRTLANAKKPIHRGILVSFCPKNASAFGQAQSRHYMAPGSCPLGHVQPLLKPVAAIAGDTVTIAPQGILVNGRLIPASQARSRDAQSRTVKKMGQGTYQVQAGEVWLISSHSPQSYDSRYFGPVPTSQIQWVVKPLLTGGD
jgi:conjugative transfer signal peptidase TraF